MYSLATATTVLLALGGQSAFAQNELALNTTGGPVIGHYARNGTVTSVREFLGIPYGMAPVGRLRFAAPLKAPKWKKPFVAADYGASCYPAVPQFSLGDSPIVLPPPTRVSEDCLNINVWTPNSKRIPRGGAAVMVWIYGGGFVLGTSETAVYSGVNMVKDQEGIILVSFNRLNVFGFPGAVGLKSKNPGLLDVRAAVEWVRDNIAKFGGDPRKITLFGESAGGAATDAYLYFAQRNPIIRGAILQSGTIAVTGALGGAAPPGTTFNKLSAAVNCTAAASSAEQVSCMRKVPAETLSKTMDSLSLSFNPSADNTTIFSDTAQRLQQGRFASIPILMGSNDQEIPGKRPEQLLATKLSFTCPASRSATAHAVRQPTWMYRYFGDFPSSTGIMNPGPYHGSEIPQVFGNFPLQFAPPEQAPASKYIQGAWAAFAKNPYSGLSTYGGRHSGWPTFDPETESLVLLAVNNTAKAVFADPAIYHTGC